jgi:hypothetical protein
MARVRLEEIELWLNRKDVRTLRASVWREKAVSTVVRIARALLRTQVLSANADIRPVPMRTESANRSLQLQKARLNVAATLAAEARTRRVRRVLQPQYTAGRPIHT